LLANLL